MSPLTAAEGGQRKECETEKKKRHIVYECFVLMPQCTTMSNQLEMCKNACGRNQNHHPKRRERKESKEEKNRERGGR